MAVGGVGSPAPYKSTGTTVNIGNLPGAKKVTAKKPPKYGGLGTPAKVGSTTAKDVNPNPTSSYGSSAVQNAVQGGTSGQGHNPSQSAAGSVGSSQYNQDTNKFTGFAHRYTPGSAQTIYDNPSIVANDVLANMGLGNNSALQGMYGDVAKNAPWIAQLYTSLSGAGSDEATINTMAEYLRQMSTPGGAAPDASKLIYALLHPGGALAEYLNPVNADGTRKTAQQQLALLQPYFGAATQGLNPLFQQGMYGALNRGLLNFNTDASHGQSMDGTSFIDYLNQNHILPPVR